MDKLINLIMVIILRCIHIPKYHIVHLKHIEFLFVSNTSVELEKQNTHLLIHSVDIYLITTLY